MSKKRNQNSKKRNPNIYIGVWILVFIVTLSALQILQLAFFEVEEVGACDRWIAKPVPTSNGNLKVQAICISEILSSGSYTFGSPRSGGTIWTSAHVPNYPNTGASGFEIVSAVEEVPKWCKLTYNIDGICQTSNFNTKENSLFTSHGVFPKTFSGQDWRVSKTENETFEELLEIQNFDKLPAFGASDNPGTILAPWSDIVGKNAFFVIEFNVPISIGKRAWLSFFDQKGLDTSGDGQLQWLFPQCACKFQGIGLPIADIYDMDSVSHFPFGPCGTEMPERDLTPMSGNIRETVSSGSTYYYSNEHDYGRTVKISKAEIKATHDWVVQNDVSIGIQYSTDNSTWKTLLKLPEGWKDKDKEFETPVEAKYIRTYARYTYAGTWRGPYAASGTYKVYAINPDYETYYEYYETNGCEFEAPELNESEDQDNDGMDDDWEDDNNIDDPDADQDNDGVTNKEEFEQGTDPNDADDFVIPNNKVGEQEEEKEEGFNITQILWYALIAGIVAIMATVGVFFIFK